MPKGYPLTMCKGCQKPVANRSELSRTGLCPSCGELKQRAALTQIAEHRGPFFLHWRRQMAASVGGRLLDDLRAAD